MISFQFAVVLKIALICAVGSSSVQLDANLAKFLGTLEQYAHLQNEVVFLLDESGSIEIENFPQVKLIAELTARQFAVSADFSRVAVVTFSTDPIVHVDYIKHSEGNNMCTLIAAIEQIPYLGLWTHTLEAMQAAQKILAHSRDGSNKIIILITDGESNSGHKPYQIAQELKSQGVIIFAIGVANVNEEEIEEVATSKNHMYILKDFLYIKKVNEYLIQDVKEISWDFIKDSSLCNNFCTSGSDCCDDHANCYCGTRSGFYECACQAGYYGSGHKRECQLCPKGTYKDVAGNKICTKCPSNSTTLKEGSASIKDCICKTGYIGDPERAIPCKSIQCASLSMPVGGVLLPKYCSNDYGSECNFKCNEGFCPYSCNSSIIYQKDLPWHHLPAVPRTCLETGQWSGDDFHCEKVRCPSLEYPQNGNHNCSGVDFTFGTTCTFNCDKGYELYGSSTRTCLLNGTWTGMATHCNIIYCPSLKINKYLNVEPDACHSKMMKFGSDCQYYCKKGYSMRSGNSTAMGINRCLADKTWSGAKEKISCQDISPPKIKCPGNILKTTDPGKSTAFITWDIANATDNIPINLEIRIKSPNNIQKPPYSFPIGETKIVYEAIDNVNLTDTCSFQVKVIDDEAPKVLFCPEDIEIYNEKKSSIAVNWKEPKFSDNSGKINMTIVNRKSGDLFSWGPVNIINYTVSDSFGNTATCKFGVKVKPYPCPFYDPPENGVIACDKWVDGRMCGVFCHEGYEFAAKQVSETIYHCSQSKIHKNQGTWMPMIGQNPAYFKLPWPDCTLKQKLNALSISFEVKYDIITCDEAAIEQMKKNFINNLVPLEKKFPGMICPKEKGCIPENVNVTCSTLSSRNKRNVNSYLYTSSIEMNEFNSYPHKHHLRHAKKKRNLQPKLVISFNVELNPNKTITGSNCESCDAEILKENTLKNASPLVNDIEQYVSNNVREVYDLTSLATPSLTFTVIATCSIGQLRINNSCVNCPAGTFKDDISDSCIDCQSATYQDKESSLSCIPCPQGYTTYQKRSKHRDDCKAPCQPGTYSKTAFEPCVACPLNYYQSLPGQNRCNKCPSGLSTWKVGAKDSTDCVAPCESGSYSDIGFEPCNLCPIGTYQPENQQKNCTLCPNATTTEFEGAKSDENCKELQFCHNQPCIYGSCVELGSDYECQCPEGIYGKNCEINEDDCVFNRCLNNGTCIDGINNYTCICRTGFTGFHCEIDINDCAQGPCKNDAECIDLLNDYICICPAGYTGKNCETNIFECASNPCQNGGICFDMLNAYRCCCPTNFTGFNCEQEININPCNSSKCNNGGTCISENESFNCSCMPGFIGEFCEININECLDYECFNGGTCIDGIENATCICPQTFTGLHCEKALTPNFTLQFPSPVTSNYIIFHNSKILQAITVSFFMVTSYKDTQSRATPVSYSYYDAFNKQEVDNGFTLLDLNKFVFYLHGEAYHTGYIANSDANWHHYALTWEKHGGKWIFFVDGKIKINGSDAEEEKYLWPGVFVLGQEQDSIGGTFSTSEAFAGNISQFNVWDYALSEKEIQNIASHCGHVGNVISWPLALKHIHGDIRIFPNNSCLACDENDCNCYYSNHSNTNICKHLIEDCTNNPCAYNHSCIFDGHNSFCNCAYGFDGRYCEYDIDECLKDNGNCSHLCINDIGSYHCSCPEGMVPEDNATCKDINFCKMDQLIYLEGENWLSSCQNCTCRQGDIICEKEEIQNITCLPEENSIHLPGTCNSQCLHLSFCLISSNDTVMTFDMSSYEFSSNCTYTLIEDCINGHFKVELDLFQTNVSEKQLIIYQECIKTVISHDGHIYIDDDLTSLPVNNNHMKITSENDTFTLWTHSGLYAHWTSDGEISLAISSEYALKTCGLCNTLDKSYSNDEKPVSNYLLPQRMATGSDACYMSSIENEQTLTSSKAPLLINNILFHFICLLLVYTYNSVYSFIFAL